MDDNCLQNVSSQCWYCSYNDVAKVLGLNSPICLGHLNINGTNEYLWYNDNESVPIFKNTDLRIILALDQLSVTQILPGTCFPHGGKFYYYDDTNLTIYQVAKFLNISTVTDFARCVNMPPKKAYPAIIKQQNGKETPVWILEQYIEEGEEWKTQQIPPEYLNIFASDDDINTTSISPAQIKLLSQGDYIVHGEELYQLELHPQYGLGLTKQEINFDTLFKT